MLLCVMFDIASGVLRPPAVGVKLEVKSFLILMSPRGGADFYYHSPQPDTSRNRKITDMRLVHHVVCPFTPQLSLVLIN